ncbi:uncharacterized protein A4U43_C02F7450 [Asparagus officinalis]|uniref:Histone-lysine N-methyltransferase ASHH1 n=1 Tax=Asparagus officinalis TaxID=4686 RepID=A0A5P1FHE8_ASPOF|nr:histone-lysine N-methyltransferase ASHH1 isoform X2 [Asparagus officinalis]ONK77522.1 uncharacterized protein A4U43_C02F7450 [Asparagus officinalis]
MFLHQGEQSEGLPPYKHIVRNEFSYRKHTKQKDEDIAVCVCRFDPNDPDSACGERCLNVLTSTECTPGYCPCGDYCRNQRFQKCEYARSRLFKTEGRGWGLLADENIKAGHFVIEYCGEVISSKEARRRSQAYEAEGLKDAFIISLNGQESIDATRKGSLARFINHSCQPNCETRKWNVLGEVRVGIFAKQDIPSGTELAYDYNFEWYGGAKVRCLCGAGCCSGFLGAKSRGFQEATYVWEDDDDRYSIENIPLYDSEDDEPSSQFLQAIVPSRDDTTIENSEGFMRSTSGHGTLVLSESDPIIVEPLNSVPMEMDIRKTEARDGSGFYPHAGKKVEQKSSLGPRIRSNSACRNYQEQSNSLPKSSTQFPGGKSKNQARTPVDVKLIGERLSKEACDELLAYEETKNQATLHLDSLYNEIRPAIEEHERDNQDSVPTSVAERWIEASCSKLKAEFDLYASIIKNISCTPRRPRDDVMFNGDRTGDGMKYLENGG